MKLFLFVIIFLPITALFAQNEITKSDNALKGVSKIHLEINIAPHSYPTLGLTKYEVYENVSYLLRKDGVEVFANKKYNTPDLIINFMVYEISKNVLEINIEESLWQQVTISSNKVKTDAITWNRNWRAHLTIGSKSDIQEIIEGICKDFINTLLAINPRG